MSWIDLYFPMLAGVNLGLALVPLSIWLREPRQWLHLAFVVTAISGAGMAMAEYMAVSAPDAATFAATVRFGHLMVTPLCLGLLWFIFMLTGARHLRLLVIAAIARIATATANALTSESSASFESVSLIAHVDFAGAMLAVPASALPGTWAWLDLVAQLSMIAFLGAVRADLRSRPPRPDVSLLCTIALVFYVVAAGTTILIHFGLARIPFMIATPWALVVVAMSRAISTEVVRSKSLERQLVATEGRASLSEQNLDLAVAAVGLALWTFDPRTQRVWLNGGAREILGRAVAEDNHLDALLARVHPDERESVEQDLRTAVESREGRFERRIRFVREEGGIRWVEVRGQRLTSNRATDANFHGVGVDVSASERADERFRIAVEAAPNAMLLVDPQGSVVLANQQAERMFGMSRQRLVSSPLVALLQGPGAPLERFSDCTSGPATALGADGAAVPVDLTMTPIESSEQRFLLAALVDVSARIRAEQEAALHRDEVAHLSRVALLGELSGSLAHELNQPLAAILSNAQAAQRFLAKDPPDLEEVAMILEDIVANDRRAGDVIRRLRALFRKDRMQLVALDPSQLVEEALRLIRNDLVNRDVVVHTRLATNLPPVAGDRIQLQQVLVNLVMNACEAMAAGGIRAPIKVDTSVEGEWVEIRVSDQGPGIAEADLERVFAPFITTKADGMGLGLTVCRTIAAAHGGLLRARPNQPRGAIFTLSLRGATGAGSGSER